MMKTMFRSMLAVLALALAGGAFAQTKLKWAHVYETSEPYHTWSVWAAGEIKKRSNGKFDLEDPHSHLASMRGLHIEMGDSAVVTSNGITIAPNTAPR